MEHLSGSYTTWQLKTKNFHVEGRKKAKIVKQIPLGRQYKLGIVHKVDDSIDTLYDVS